MDTAQILASLRAEQKKISAAIAVLEKIGPGEATNGRVPARARGKAAKSARKARVLSSEGKKRIADAAKRRWAKWRKENK